MILVRVLNKNFLKTKPENIRANIPIRFRLGIKVKVILSQLKTAVPDHVPI